jgi:hypothetical protein
MRLQFMRNVLGEGFDVHCKENEFVQQVLDLEEHAVGVRTGNQDTVGRQRRAARQRKYDSFA